MARGLPVSNMIFSLTPTINSANHVDFLASHELNAKGNLDASISSSCSYYVFFGAQAIDLYWGETLICPKENDYFEMNSNRVGVLFRLTD